MSRRRNQLKRPSQRSQEVNNGKPVSIPVDAHIPETFQAKIRRFVRSEALAAYADAQGVETYEESQDFDCPDDLILYPQGKSGPRTEYDLEYDPETGEEIEQQEMRARIEDRRLAEESAKNFVKQKKKAAKIAAQKKEAARERRSEQQLRESDSHGD